MRAVGILHISLFQESIQIIIIGFPMEEIALNYSLYAYSFMDEYAASYSSRIFLFSFFFGVLETSWTELISISLCIFLYMIYL